MNIFYLIFRLQLPCLVTNFYFVTRTVSAGISEKKIFHGICLLFPFFFLLIIPHFSQLPRRGSKRKPKLFNNSSTFHSRFTIQMLFIQSYESNALHSDPISQTQKLLLFQSHKWDKLNDSTMNVSFNFEFCENFVKVLIFQVIFLFDPRPLAF